MIRLIRIWRCHRAADAATCGVALAAHAAYARQRLRFHEIFCARILLRSRHQPTLAGDYFTDAALDVARYFRYRCRHSRFMPGVMPAATPDAHAADAAILLICFAQRCLHARCRQQGFSV